MAISDLTDPAAVEAALDEFDTMGRASFLARYGFGEALRFFVSARGRLYDSKAIVGAAHGHQFPARGPLSHEDFSGGDPTTKKLHDLGYEVVDVSLTRTSSGRVFGEIPGYPAGSLFDDRPSLSGSRVHRPRQAGISGGGKEGADSIVVSGGYEDDEDYGNLIIYTGHGGNDSSTGRQVADQTLLSATEHWR